MGRSRWFKSLGVFLALFLLTPSASAHEQNTYNVILIEGSVLPGNVTDPAFIEGNKVMFHMGDSTNNTSMQIRIVLNHDGVFESGEDNLSVWLTHSCEVDENNSLVDETCAVSHKFVFGNTSAGTYSYQVERVVNNSTTDVWNHTILVHPDIHEEPGQPNIGDCFGAGCDEEVSDEVELEQPSSKTESALYAVMVIASLGAFMLILSIRNDRLNQNSTSPINGLEEAE